MDARLVGPTNGPSAGVMVLGGNTPSPPSAELPRKTGKRQAEAVGTHRFPTCGEAVPKGLKGLFSTNTHSPARKTTGGAPFLPP